MAAMGKISPRSGKFRLSRRGRKLQISDDPRILLALPKDVPERTWAEILQKEENDLICFEIREDIFDEALQIVYKKYMEKQTALFTVHCVAEAWLKLIDWHFYRHDPGEDPSAYPSCYIPKRVESWIPDDLPEPSPKDSWGQCELKVIEECPDFTLQRWDSSSSLEINETEEIPEQYWFPGKVELVSSADVSEKKRTDDRQIPLKESKSSEESSSESDLIGTDSEVLQRVTNYSGLQDDGCGVNNYKDWSPSLGSYSNVSYMQPEEKLDNESEELQRVTDYTGITEFAAGDKFPKSGTKHSNITDDFLVHGAGDSSLRVDIKFRGKRNSRIDKSKSSAWSRASLGRCRGLLPPLLADSLSCVSNISDCRLRNLRMDTHYEVSSEKIDTPPVEQVKRK